MPCMRLARGRSSTIAALAEVSSPLLKFQDGKAFLHDEGRDRISKIRGRIYPVIFMGDGRVGKSYLASRVLNLDEAVISSDSAEPVTEGIDIVVFPMKELLASTPGFEAQAQKDDEEPMHMLVLDCEGGNNAMAAIRMLVNIFGIVMGSEVVFVAGGSFSEAALQNLGASLAARSLIELDESSRLPEQKLIFVVNKNTFKYNDDTLEKTLKAEQKDPGRRESRQLVNKFFSERKFLSIPLMGTPDFEDQVSSLRKAIINERRPLKMGGVEVCGAQLNTLLELIVSETQKMSEVSFQSMSRCVVLDGFLRPMANRLIEEASKSIPELEDYDSELASKDPRPSALTEFDKQAAHVTDRTLVEEAIQHLKDKLDAEWLEVIQINDAFGEQVKETTTESREVVTNKTRVPLGGEGLLARVALLQQMVRIESRTVMTKKKGDTEYTAWLDSVSPAQRIYETAFHNFSATVPSLMGTLLKRSPSLIKTVMSLGAGVFQERACVVKEGHIAWWDPGKTTHGDQEVCGAINFLINRATCEEDPENPNIFLVKPAEGEGWSDHESFGGGKHRELTFNVEGSQFTREQWIGAVRKNIEFANLAHQQLGVERIKNDIGTHIPVLSKTLWGVKRG